MDLISTFWSSYQQNQETPKEVEAIVFYLGCLTEVEGNILLYVTPHTSEQDLKKTELELRVKYSSWGLVFRILPDDKRTSQGKMQLIVLFSYKSFQPQK